MTIPWARWETDTINDDKIALWPIPEKYAAFYTLFSLTQWCARRSVDTFGMKNGKPFSDEDAANIFRMDVNDYKKAVALLTNPDKGMVETRENGLFIKNLNKYNGPEKLNHKSKLQVERNRRYREKLKGGATETGATPATEKMDVFNAYEQNMGLLTPMIADQLKDAETEYTAEWVIEAIGVAVKQEKRNWSYCEAILKRWKVEGKGNGSKAKDGGIKGW